MSPLKIHWTCFFHRCVQIIHNFLWWCVNISNQCNWVTWCRSHLRCRTRSVDRLHARPPSRGNDTCAKLVLYIHPSQSVNSTIKPRSSICSHSFSAMTCNYRCPIGITLWKLVSGQADWVSFRVCPSFSLKWSWTQPSSNSIVSLILPELHAVSNRWLWIGYDSSSCLRRSPFKIQMPLGTSISKLNTLSVSLLFWLGCQRQSHVFAAKWRLDVSSEFWPAI